MRYYRIYLNYAHLFTNGVISVWFLLAQAFYLHSPGDRYGD